MRILGHTGRILGSYLHDLLQSRHSNFVAMMQLENHNFNYSSLVWLFQYQKLLSCFFDKSQISPDGSKTSSSLILSTMKSVTIPISSRCFVSSSGAQPVLPMVIAPEAIVKSFSSIGSSILSSHLPSCIILLLISSGGYGRILLKRLWLLWLCYLHDGQRLMHGYPLI
jgi:hypothetical protein